MSWTPNLFRSHQSFLSQLAKAHCDDALAMSFRAHMQEVILAEIGLPQCDEVNFAVMESPLDRTYNLLISFPGNYTASFKVSQLEMGSAALPSYQLTILEDGVRRLARDWARKI